MRRFEDEVYFVGDKLLFCSRVASPKNEYHGGAFFVEQRNYSVGEDLPSLSLVALRPSLSDGQGSVEKKHALLCPARKLAACRFGNAVFRVKLLEDVLE